MSESRGSIHVLVVDDDRDARELAASHLDLESDRLVVDTTGTPEEALSRLETDRVDCVVSDYDMPGMDGIEFLEAVRENHGSLPFVLYTGKGSEEVASESVSKGVTEYLRKRTERGQYTVLANRIENVVDGHRSERALAERNRRLETIISNLPGVVYRCRDARGWPMEYVEGECEPLTGYPREAIVEGEVSWGGDVVHPEDRERVWEAVQAALDAGEYFEVTYRIRTKSGALRWVWERGRGVGEADEAEAIEGFVTDVTERRERELAIEALQAATEALLGADSAEAVADTVAEAATGVLGFTNAGVRLLDEEGAVLEPVAISDESRVTVEERPAFPVGEGLVGEAFERGRLAAYDDIGDIDDGYDHRDVRSLLVVPLGDHGVLTAVDVAVGAFDESQVDLAAILARNAEAVLDRIGGEVELERQGSLLEAVLETSIDGIHVVDEDREIVAYNRRFVDMWDIPEAALAARSSERALSSVLDQVERPEAFLEKIHYLYDHPEEESRDRVPLDDGRVFDRYSAPVETGEDRYGRVWFYRDITETIERERELERQNERLDEFVGVISHDLRGPLNVAMGRLELARAECDSESLDAVSDAHDRMVTLIDDLLALAREGRSVGETESVHVADVARAAWDVVGSGEGTLDLETGRRLEADRSRLQQLLENLFRNAVEHAGPAPGVAVGDLADGVGVYVEDDGPGLPTEESWSVFDSGATTTEDGTGFGLTIVRQIAEAHGWEISATEGEDGGARFEIRVDGVPEGRRPRG